MKIVPADDLVRLLTPWCDPTMLDAEYALPSSGWVGGAFASALLYNFRSLGLTFENESWDCDKFARMAAALAWVCHYRTSGHRAALALGVFCYVSPKGPHALNFAVTGMTPDEVIFLEPQTCQIMLLTEKEKQSCQFMLL